MYKSLPTFESQIRREEESRARIGKRKLDQRKMENFDRSKNVVVDHRSNRLEGRTNILPSLAARPRSRDPSYIFQPVNCKSFYATVSYPRPNRTNRAVLPSRFRSRAGALRPGSERARGKFQRKNIPRISEERLKVAGCWSFLSFVKLRSFRSSRDEDKIDKFLSTIP